ncbi:hypothetical protein ACP4OV_004254 [Aristida adscensionis]
MKCDYGDDGSDSGDEEEAHNAVGPVTRSSVKKVASVVAKFDEVKRGLVIDIGFGGILDLPQINKIDQKFIVWLLSKVDVERKAIVVNGTEVMDMVDFDVDRVMGIPCGHLPVCGLGVDDSDSKGDFIRDCIGAERGERNSLLAAERNVMKNYATMNEKKQIDRFKISFVVWVMGKLLAPTKKSNFGGDEFWGALKDADEVKKYNWSAYVLEELFIAARDVQNQLSQKKAVAVMTGCTILLQVMYLDSLSMGNLSAPRDVYPRIKCYDKDRLRLMIQADKASCAAGSENPSWGSSVRHLPKRVTESMYQTTRVVSENLSHCDPLVKDFGRVVRELFRDKLSLQQISTVNWFNARCRRHLCELRNNIQEDTITLVQKLVGSSGSIQNCTVGNLGGMQFYTEPSKGIHECETSKCEKRARGSDYSNYDGATEDRVCKKQFQDSRGVLGYSDDAILPINVATQRTVRDTISAEYEDNRIVRCELSSSSGGLQKQKDTEYVPGSNGNLAGTYRGLSFEIPSFDLGIDFEEPEPEPEPEVGLEVVVQPDGVLTHSNASSAGFSEPMKKGLGVTALDDTLSKLNDGFSGNVKSLEDNKSLIPIVKHHVLSKEVSRSPWWYGYSHRQVNCAYADEVFSKMQCCFEGELSSIWITHSSLRCIKMDGAFIRSVFTLEGPLSYDMYDILIRRLRQLDWEMYSHKGDMVWRHILESDFAANVLTIIVPVVIKMNWSCYFWDFKEKCIHVIDPLYTVDQESMYQKLHVPNMDIIGAGFANLIDRFYDNWSIYWSTWSMKFVVPSISDATSHETGLLSLLYAREYDGKILRRASRECFEEFKKALLYELLCIEDNKSKPAITVLVSELTRMMSDNVESAGDVLSCMTHVNDPSVDDVGQSLDSGYEADNEASLASSVAETSSVSVESMDHEVEMPAEVGASLVHGDQVAIAEGSDETSTDAVPVPVLEVPLDQGDGHSHNTSPMPVEGSESHVVINLRRRRIEVETEAEKRARLSIVESPEL